MNELNVKVGDKVIVNSGYGYNGTERLSHVVKVTPTGRIKVAGSDAYFDKNGREMGKKDIWKARDYLVIPKEKDYQRLKDASDIQKAKTICNNLIEKMTAETARKIIENFGERS